MKSGFLLVDKKEDWTSHDVVAYLRGVTKIKKIGHAGTLDPFATGLLLIGIGREATKQLDTFKHMEKTYVATLHLGATSDTFDKTGAITKSTIDKQPTESEMQKMLKVFLGKQEQIPSMYSAKKVGGKKLYELARKGIEIERKPSRIEITQIEMNAYAFPEVHITVTCSSGTYIRTLCHDIGQKLGVGAYCSALRRTAIGAYSVLDAITLDGITKEIIETHLKETQLQSD